MIRDGSRVALVGKDVRKLIDIISVPIVYWSKKREVPPAYRLAFGHRHWPKVQQATATINSSTSFGHPSGVEDVVMDNDAVRRLTYKRQTTCPNGGPFVMARPFGLEYPMHGLEASVNPAWKDLAWRYNPKFEWQDGI